MSASEHDASEHDAPEHDMDHDDTIGKLDTRHRQQLSALLDGDLAPDQAGFLLRRLQHDQALRERFGRWQLAGDVLRGRKDALLPPDFPERVDNALAESSMPAAGGQRRAWSRGLGGLALVASVALIAVLVTQRLPGQGGPDGVPAQVPVAGAAGQMPGAGAAMPSAAAPRGSVVASLDTAAPAVGDTPATPARASQAPRQSTPVAPVAVASVPQFPPPTEQALPTQTPPSADIAPMTVADTAPALQLPAPGADNPFLPEPETRPWPSARLSDFPQADTFTASYAGDDAIDTSQSAFYPFVPRLPENARPATGSTDPDMPPAPR